jgi:hypothetical protein
LELPRRLLDDRFYFRIGGQSETLEDLAAKCASWWFEAGLCPVDAGEAASVVPTVGVFTVVDYNAGVEEGCAEGPEDGGEPPSLQTC